MKFRAAVALAGLTATAVVAFVPIARAGEELDGGRAAKKAAAELGLRDLDAVVRDVDAALAQAWKEQGLNPSWRCSDEEFARRVYLDLVGTIPSAQQVEAFLADQHMDKREKLVETLLRTPGYSRNFANLWSEVLVGSGTAEKDKDFAPAIFRPWLEKELAARRPYPELIREILTANGSPYSNPPVNFFGRATFSATDLAGRTSQAFLGVKIQCAQCHDHPYEETIKQKDFQGMASFFARMTLRPAEIPYEMLGDRAMKGREQREDEQIKAYMKNGMTEEQAKLEVQRKRPKTVEVGEIGGDAGFPKRMRENAQRLEKIPAEVAKATPKFLRSVEYQDVAGSTRRKGLADWIVNPANPYTSKALANRYWGWLFGRGIVSPVDDFSSVNIPTVPAALDILAKDTAESGFDFDRLVRVITSTKAYQLSSASPRRDKKAQEFFSAGPIKQFTPQQTFDSLEVALGVVADPTLMSDVAGGAPSAIEMEGGRYGQMAMGDDDNKDRTKAAMTFAAKNFFKAFDDDEGDGVTSFEGTIPQGLFLLNSKVVNGLLTNPAISVIPKIVNDKTLEGDRAKIRHLFVRTLSRAPTEKETARFVAFVKSSPPEGGTPTSAPVGKGKRPARPGRMGPPEQTAMAPYADVLWALVSSSEFGTNH